MSRSTTGDSKSYRVHAREAERVRPWNLASMAQQRANSRQQRRSALYCSCRVQASISSPLSPSTDTSDLTPGNERSERIVIRRRRAQDAAHQLADLGSPLI